ALAYFDGNVGECQHLAVVHGDVFELDHGTPLPLAVSSPTAMGTRTKVVCVAPKERPSSLSAFSGSRVNPTRRYRAPGVGLVDGSRSAKLETDQSIWSAFVARSLDTSAVCPGLSMPR